MIKNKLLITSIFLIVSVICILPFFHSGFFPMHDDTQVVRVFEMQKALADKQFPARWVEDLGYGYGYPLFNFYAPFPYYVGGLINLVGANALLATKLIEIIGILLAGVGMYFLAREFWGELGGIVSATFYLLAPYHALDIYVRGDIAEIYAYAVIPFVFLFIYKISSDKKWKFISLASLFYAILILSHNLTALMVTPFIVAWIIFIYFSSIRKTSLLYFLTPLLIGIMVAAFYWIPSLLELKYTNILSQIGGGSNFKDHFVCLTQLWNSPWGFGGSAPGCIDGLSFRLGKLHVLVALFSVLLIFIKIKRDKKLLIIFLFTMLVGSTFLTLDWSKLIWQIITPMKFFQFPWRFLLLASFFSSLLAGSVLSFSKLIKNQQISKLGEIVVLFGLVLGMLFLYEKLFIPSKYLAVNSTYYTRLKNINLYASNSSSEYMPSNFERPKNLTNVPKGRIEIFSGLSKIISTNSNSKSISANIITSSNTKIKINIAYFPFWRLFIDNRTAVFSIKNDGLYFNLYPGIHNISLVLMQTPVENFSNLLSLAGILLVLIGIIKSYKYNE